MGRILNSGQFLDMVEHLEEDNKQIVWKYQRYQNEIKHGAKLIVRPGQAAILVHNGQLADVFDNPGTYVLKTKNLPILSTIAAIPFGFNSPLKSDVFFINTTQFFGLKWTTREPILRRDPEMGIVRISASGSYAFQVADPECFFKTVYGAHKLDNTEAVADYLSSFIGSAVAECIGMMNTSVLDLAMQFRQLGDMVSQYANEKAQRLGIIIPEAVIEHIKLPKEVEGLIDEQSGISLASRNMGSFMQYQAARAMRDAAQQEGGLAGLGASYVIGQQFAQTAMLSSIQPPGLPQSGPSSYPGGNGGQQNTYPGGNGGQQNTYPGGNGGQQNVYPQGNGGQQAYPQGNGGQQNTYPGGNGGQQNAYPQGNGGQQAYPQGNGGQQAYPQGNTRQQNAYPQGNTRQQNAYPQGNTRQQNAYPQGNTRQQNAYPQRNTRQAGPSPQRGARQPQRPQNTPSGGQVSPPSFQSALPDMVIPQLTRPVQKGQKTPLSASGSAPRQIKVCFGWNVADARCDIDASAFLVGTDGKVPGDSWFVFYGQEQSPDGSVTFSVDSSGKDREILRVDLGRLNQRIQKLVFVMTINEALERNLNFSMIRDAYVRILDASNNRELVSYRINEYYNSVTSMTIGELYLHKGQWKFNPVGNGVHQDLAGQCAIYGVEIE